LAIFVTSTLLLCIKCPGWGAANQPWAAEFWTEASGKSWKHRKTQKNIELAVETLSLCLPGFCGFFSARQHICYSALYAVAHPSVCLSVCHTGGSVKDSWS